jgi:hypothetical protein
LEISRLWPRGRAWITAIIDYTVDSPAPAAQGSKAIFAAYVYDINILSVLVE